MLEGGILFGSWNLVSRVTGAGSPDQGIAKSAVSGGTMRGRRVSRRPLEFLTPVLKKPTPEPHVVNRMKSLGGEGLRDLGRP